MTMESYCLARSLLEKSGDGDFEGSKSESLVAKAETALGLRFPPTYRSFLLDFGCGDFRGLEVFGIIDENFEKSSIPNGIWLTLNERRAIGLSHELVIVGEGGDGTYCAIDTSRRSIDGESPVVRLSVDGSTQEPVAADFGDYLLAAIRR